jgi:hypothetical protein
MKTIWLAIPPGSRFVWAAALALLLAGCATPRIDWAARVGNYTLDQAIVEIGPPDKQAKLTDGTVVADWLTRRGYYYTYPSFGYHRYYPGWYYGPGYVERSPDYFLRLTFGPDSRLQTWKKFTR